MSVGTVAKRSCTLAAVARVTVCRHHRHALTHTHTQPEAKSALPRCMSRMDAEGPAKLFSFIFFYRKKCSFGVVRRCVRDNLSPCEGRWVCWSPWRGKR